MAGTLDVDEVVLRDADGDGACAICGDDSTYAVDRGENISLFLCHGCVDVGLKVVEAFGFTVSRGGALAPVSGWWS